jgi:hypothetical protein
MGDNRPGTSVASQGVNESSVAWPMLTHTNYIELAMLMQIDYEAMEILDAIDPGTSVRCSINHQTMSALMRSVSKEMWGTLGAKDRKGGLGGGINHMRIGADRVKKVNVRSC